MCFGGNDYIMITLITSKMHAGVNMTRTSNMMSLHFVLDRGNPLNKQLFIHPCLCELALCSCKASHKIVHFLALPNMDCLRAWQILNRIDKLDLAKCRSMGWDGIYCGYWYGNAKH